MNTEQQTGRADHDALSPVDLGICTHIDAFLQNVGDVNSRQIVDIGCGEGRFGKELARRGARVTGIDPLMDPVEQQQIESGTYCLLQTGAQDIPLAAASADLATFMFSLHHMPEGALVACLGEAIRLLRPAGRLYVAEPLAEGPFYHLTAPFHDEAKVRADALRALGEIRSRFRVTNSYRYFERRVFPDFSSFVKRMTANTRFNDYDMREVTSPLVVARFDKLFAENGGNFDQPVFVNVFSDPIAS